MLISCECILLDLYDAERRVSFYKRAIPLGKPHLRWAFRAPHISAVPTSVWWEIRLPILSKVNKLFVAHPIALLWNSKEYKPTDKKDMECFTFYVLFWQALLLCMPFVLLIWCISLFWENVLTNVSICDRL